MTPRRRALVAAALAGLGVASMLAVAVWIDWRHSIAGDGHYVFAAARSLAFDGDLDLTNQYRLMGDRWGLGRDPCDDGWRLPPREIGPSLLMVPGLWLHHALNLAPHWAPACASLLAAASLGPCWLACTLLLDGCNRDRSRRSSEWLAAAALFAFVVPFYAVGRSGYPHAGDALTCAWLLWALASPPRAGPRGERIRSVTVGLLLACAVLMRLQNLLWLLWPLADLLAASKDTRRPRALALLTISSLALLGVAPQLWLAWAHPGSLHGVIRWDLSFFDLADFPTDLARVLVGVHGLLRWTPITALALLGLGWSAFAPRPVFFQAEDG
ncbi:MAG: hypothetical protein KC431_16145, partial [Myxococcales bacterium]|nr:hypothetical protein [Myxococcales bacterium]